MESIVSASNTERVYSLDALRAIMMLLGVVIHSAITYASADFGDAWPLKDPINSFFFDILVAFVHSFRMPVFFLAAGYFSALLLARKGPESMLISRVRRILLPLLVAVVVGYPLVLFAFLFSSYSFAGVPSAFQKATALFPKGAFLPYRLIHLWFLYYLMLYVLIGWLTAKVIKKKMVFATLLTTGLGYLLQRVSLRILTITVAFYGCLSWMGGPFIKTSFDWYPHGDIFVTYLLFFGTGWLIFTTDTLKRMATYPIGQLVLSTLLFLAFVFVPWPSAPWVLPAKIGLSALFSTLFVFGFVALFQRYFNHYSPRLSYLMESAYWVYIIHLPIVAFVPGVLASFSLPIFLKFSITLCSGTILSLLSYHYLVRGTVVGLFLNGKIRRRLNQTL